ncbi:MAG: Hsp70 family protein [Polyangiaceae bacterium]|nr:Hsp70 family protein [Polyangiaceae bacterium]
MMTSVVGIDLGTTNTVVAAQRGQHVVTLADEGGRTLIPSIVSFCANGSVQVGEPARQNRLNDPTATVYSIKRLIGRSWASDEVRLARERLPFQMEQGPGQAPMVAVRGQTYALAEISAFVLRKARSVAEAALGPGVERAVITVPASFNDLQRAATKVAARVAGLETLRILNEPTAAAIACGLDRGKSGRIAVYDFGGGTFDVTLIELSHDVLEVLSTAGDSFLGGDDIDVAMSERLAEQLQDAVGELLQEDPSSFERIRSASELLKRELSSREQAATDVEFIGTEGHRQAARVSMTRTELERLATPIVERTFDVCERALEIARFNRDALDHVLLVGGSTRMPLVRRRVETYFGRSPESQFNPDEVVAIGAAMHAAALAGGVRRSSMIPMPPAVSRRPPARAPASGSPPTRNDVGTLIASRTPPAQSLKAALPGPDSSSSAPRASSAPPHPRASATAPLANADVPLAPSGAPALLVDVTPLTLCVETVNGFCETVIARNAAVPCEGARTFVTAIDNQVSVRVAVGQGESHFFAENTLLGELQLYGLRAAPRGEVNIKVIFALDRDGILNVRAIDAATRKTTSARLRLVGLPDSDHLQLMKERHDAMPSAPNPGR